ncbi:MAG: Eco57I restriction-modification methylase domain-containing protein, partial [Phycisphaerales bacterium]|nr:Eco57I restriction-modification methylase domain-containing protein [Phycisphaerales bacterium]
MNLLLQVSRVLGALSLVDRRPGNFALGVLHIDSLLAKSAARASFEELDPEFRPEHVQLTPDPRFGLVPLDGDKLAAFARLCRDGEFDLVVGNPPYVAEANNRVLFERLRAIESWRGIYRGKTDYLYYFLILALEKVRPGGRLCVITPAGWMNAVAADFLRGRLASELRLDELFLFGSHRLFAPAPAPGERRRRVPTPTVESAILVATKRPAPPGHALRVVALEDE